MANVQVPMEEMLQRVARFSQIRPNKQAFVDTNIPEHQRENYRIIGRGVSEDPNDAPSITAPHEFNVGMVRADHGKGAALHSHPTVEIFMAFKGRWTVYWGDDGEHEVVLEPGDLISVPPGVMRGFRSANTDPDAWLLTIIGGADAGKVTWSEKVLQRARETGLERDATGNLRSLN